MKSIYSGALVAVTALLGATQVAAFAIESDGCYTSTTGLTFNATLTYNSQGSCSTNCLGLEMPVMAMQDQKCYCGSELPPASTVTDNSTCSTTCPGYPANLCE